MSDSEFRSDTLANKTILVTGAYGGLGRVAAKTFAKHEATVILLGRNVDKLEAVYDEIEDAGCPQPAIIEFDLEQTDPDLYQGLADMLYQNFGKLDGMVHAAAQMGHLGPLQGQQPELWSRVMQVNLHAPYLLTRACLPVAMESSGSSIVFISDSSANLSKAYWGAYGISKVALESLAQILSEETESTSVHVRTLLPGPMRSPMRLRTHPGEDQSGLTTPDDFAEQILELMLVDTAQNSNLH